VYILQRYWVSRKSYISVTGKPTGGGTGFVKEPLIRWTFITLTLLVLALVLALYAAIFLGSITRLWGIDYTLDFTHYGRMFAAGLTAILDTTFLSALATPIAGIAGMVIAYLVVRKTFTGKEALDFTSNLAARCRDDPGHRLHHRLYSSADAGRHFDLRDARLLPDCARRTQFHRARCDSAGGDAAGHGVLWLNLNTKGREPLLATAGSSLWQVCPFWTCQVGDTARGRTGCAGVVQPIPGREKVAAGDCHPARADGNLPGVAPIHCRSHIAYHHLGTRVGREFLASLCDQLAKWINLLFQAPMAFLGFTYTVLGAFVAGRLTQRARAIVSIVLVAVGCALTFWDRPLALVGSPYIILAAYAVRSLPASVRAGMASLQQIDPAIEEASTNLGADASLTFRKITLPLILRRSSPVDLSFARHMTSLSAIIFLSSAKWRF